MAGRNESSGTNLQGILLAALLVSQGGGTLIGARGQDKVVEELAGLRQSVEKATDELSAQRRELMNHGERLQFLETDHERRLHTLETLLGKHIKQ